MSLLALAPSLELCTDVPCACASSRNTTSGVCTCIHHFLHHCHRLELEDRRGKCIVVGPLFSGTAMSAQRKVKVINIALCVQRALALPFAAGGGAHPARCARQVQQTPSKQPALYIPCAFAMSLLYILQSSSTRSSQCLQAQHCFLQKQQSCLALLGAVPCPAAIAGLHGTVLDAHDSLQSCAGCLMSQERRTLLTHVDEYTGVWSDSPQTVPPPQETQLAATKPPVPANMDNYCAV